MKCLFIHYNFPANFRNFVLHLAKNRHEVIFISEYSRRDIIIPEVQHIQIRMPAHPHRENPAERALIHSLRRAESCGNVLLKLKNKGYSPDIIYYHAGFGHGTFVADVFPNTPRIAYLEWHHSMDLSHNPLSRDNFRSTPSEFAGYHMRNMFQTDALVNCTLAIAPTEWQKMSYPAEFHKKIQVAHDGIDTGFFAPRDPHQSFSMQDLTLASYKELVTYATRTIENSRGFAQFYRCIPDILRARPGCHIMIMTRNTSRSGHPAPNEAICLDGLRKKTPANLDRLHLVGFRSLEEYRRILQASTVHVHLAPPFALANSLLEAMSAGCLVVASDTLPLTQEIKHGKNGFIADFWDHNMLTRQIIQVLEQEPKLNAVRKAARDYVRERFDISITTPRHMFLLEKTVAP